MNISIAATNGATPRLYTQTQLRKAARQVAKEQNADLRAFSVRLAPYPVLNIDLTRNGFCYQSSLAI